MKTSKYLPRNSEYVDHGKKNNNDSTENANLKLAVIISVSLILLLNVAAMIYRNDVPSKVVL
jgi:hypothetical protein